MSKFCHPYLPCLCLHGFHAWINYHIVYGREPHAGSYNDTVMDCWMEHMTDLTNATNSSKDTVKPPPRLMNLADWHASE